MCNLSKFNIRDAFVIRKLLSFQSVYKLYWMFRWVYSWLIITIYRIQNNAEDAFHAPAHSGIFSFIRTHYIGRKDLQNSFWYHFSHDIRQLWTPHLPSPQPPDEQKHPNSTHEHFFFRLWLINLVHAIHVLKNIEMPTFWSSLQL